MCEAADDGLFASVLHNGNHVLAQLLPPIKETPYQLRPCAHNRSLPIADTLMQKNFIERMLYKDSYWSSLISTTYNINNIIIMCLFGTTVGHCILLLTSVYSHVLDLFLISHSTPMFYFACWLCSSFAFVSRLLKILLTYLLTWCHKATANLYLISVGICCVNNIFFKVSGKKINTAIRKMSHLVYLSCSLGTSMNQFPIRQACTVHLQIGRLVGNLHSRVTLWLN